VRKTRREFLRGAIGWGGLLLAGVLESREVRPAEPLGRAHCYLAARQSPDGAWRSGRYAAFRDGDALTPVVLWAVMPEAAFPGRSKYCGRSEGGSPDDWFGRDAQTGGRDAHSTRDLFARGMDWLRDFTDALRDRDDPWLALRYPLFTASYSAQVLARSGDADRAAVWVKIIRALRTSGGLGWPAHDPMCGAWSDASRPPRYVSPVPDMLAPNISATALAVTALASAGCADESLTARLFLEQCQNFAEAHPTEFDDGGFFFALDDPIRNKAGRAGSDGSGRVRFRSYGSATGDGWLALRACGWAREHPRLRAAAEWLRDHCDGITPGGDWPAGRAEARASLAYYESQALAAVLADLPPADGWGRTLRETLIHGLLEAQSDDGSWQGLAPDSCEDEPLLASAFAVRALSLLTA
jgi:hypothetical protein